MDGLQTGINVFELIQQGDKKAFDSFFLRHYSVLCGYAAQFVDPEDAEEIVQDIMVWLWESRETIVIQTTLIQYLFKAVKNKSINLINRNYLKERVHQSLSMQQERLYEDPDFYIVEELTRKIEEALQELPDNYRDVFVLNRIEGKHIKRLPYCLKYLPKP